MIYELPKLGHDFITFLKVNDFSENTITSYTQKLHDFFSFIKNYKALGDKISDINESTISKINITDLNSFIANLSEKRNIKNKQYESSTKSTYIACLKSFFKYLKETAKIINISPAIELKSPKGKQTIAKYLNIEECSKLLKNIEDERNYAIIVMYLNCGMRLSELVNIKIKDIKKDSFGTKIVVNGKGNKERTLYLNDTCLNSISKYLEIRPKCDVEELFVCEHIKNVYTKMKPNTIQKITNKYVKAASLDAHVHTFRHTFSSIANANGVDIKTLQEQLGHSRLSTTEKYIHSFNGNTSKVAQMVNIG